MLLYVKSSNQMQVYCKFLIAKYHRPSAPSVDYLWPHPLGVATTAFVNPLKEQQAPLYLLYESVSVTAVPKGLHFQEKNLGASWPLKF